MVKGLRKFIDLQAEDEGLWFVAETASEAYVQRGLRGCHQYIEEQLAALDQTEPYEPPCRENRTEVPCD